jgi:hypothetical protein
MHCIGTGGREPTAGVNTLLLDLPKDRVLAATNRFVLIVHDGSSSRRGIITQITSKARNRRDHNDNAELAAFLACLHTCVDNSPANRVENGTLLIASSGDWER